MGSNFRVVLNALRHLRLGQRIFAAVCDQPNRAQRLAASKVGARNRLRKSGNERRRAQRLAASKVGATFGAQFNASQSLGAQRLAASKVGAS